MAHIPISWKDFLLPPPQLSLTHKHVYHSTPAIYHIFWKTFSSQTPYSQSVVRLFYREKMAVQRILYVCVFLLLIPPVFYDDEDDDFTFSCALCAFETKKCTFFIPFYLIIIIIFFAVFWFV